MKGGFEMKYPVCESCKCSTAMANPCSQCDMTITGPTYYQKFSGLTQLNLSVKGDSRTDNTRILFDFLNLITSFEIKDFVRMMLEKLPDYFFKVPASSTGKYHPKFAEGEGGLVRHTIMAVKIADELLRIEMYMPLLEVRDEILAALILHDGLKHGENNSPHTVFEHPVLMRDFINKNNNGNVFAYRISDLVASHMGQWNTNLRSEVVLPKPETKAQKFVHMCDYLASRKFFDIGLEN
jgi:23S rRNA maturation-related 3'-5' exoribonuclease YhaM